MCPAYSELAKVYAGSNSDIQGLISKYSDAFTKVQIVHNLLQMNSIGSLTWSAFLGRQSWVGEQAG